MQTLKGRRVLVVDDEPMIRLMIADELVEQGCTVMEAGNGKDALETFSGGGKFDLLVTDIRMPGMDGWTLAERARVVQPGLSVLYVTGYSGETSRPVADAEVLPKPFIAAELVEAVSRVIC